MSELKPNSITITYLSKITFASLNGADKEIDNINPIKKITMSNGEELPYLSAQAVRRALRDKLTENGIQMSPISEASANRGAPKTECDPEKYIDDDLFGYMDAEKGKDGGKGKSTVRTSPIRVESLVALSNYKGDLDFGTNYMGKGKKDKTGKDIQPNIFETEIHSGIYRGSILIELDRIGCGDGFENQLNKKEKKKRALAFINAFRNLWNSGRQTRFLADISPKFIAGAYMTTKNPIFLESVTINENGKIDEQKLKSVVTDYDKYINDYIFATQEAVFEKSGDLISLKDGFGSIEKWIGNYYEDED